MSERKTTSGPWAVKTEGELEPCIVTDDGFYVATAHAAPGDGDAKANAALISAAPELLAALESLVEANRGVDCPRPGCTVCSMFRAANAAIAKARASP
jgi:hypothetical protein